MDQYSFRHLPLYFNSWKIPENFRSSAAGPKPPLPTKSSSEAATSPILSCLPYSSQMHRMHLSTRHLRSSHQRARLRPYTVITSKHDPIRRPLSAAGVELKHSRNVRRRHFMTTSRRPLSALEHIQSLIRYECAAFDILPAVASRWTKKIALHKHDSPSANSSLQKVHDISILSIKKSAGSVLKRWCRNRSGLRFSFLLFDLCNWNCFQLERLFRPKDSQLQRLPLYTTQCLLLSP